MIGLGDRHNPSMRSAITSREGKGGGFEGEKGKEKGEKGGKKRAMGSSPKESPFSTFCFGSIERGNGE